MVDIFFLLQPEQTVIVPFPPSFMGRGWGVFFCHFIISVVVMILRGKRKVFIDIIETVMIIT